MTTKAPAGTLKLDEQLCFALYNASRAFTACYRDVLAPFGLTYPQYLVMLSLWEHAPASVHELGQRLYLDTGTLSPLLKRLEGIGLITRARSAEDERVVLVDLTAQGEELRASGLGISAAVCQQADLPMTELQDLRRRVQDLADAMRTQH